MKKSTHIFSVILLTLSVLLTITSCKYIKKKVPPHEMFAEAEKLRKSGYLLEAAKEYDKFFDSYEESELAPAALYYSGMCKYTLSTRCPGKKEFEQQKGGLSDIKKRQYEQCTDYMNDHKDAFLYGETIDKYLYTGIEFEKLIESYPSSNTVDDAAFQLARTKIVAKQQMNTLTVTVALQLYTEFFQKYPQSQYRQKGIEDLIKLISEYSESLAAHKTLVETYKELAALADTLPELAKISYLLGKKCIEEGNSEHAAPILGVPSVVGIGIVSTRQTRLNIRSGQGTNYKIIAKAEKGEEVIVLESTGQWYHVQLQDGTTGYAHSNFIKINTE